MVIIVKTPLGMEQLAATAIEELGFKAVARPNGVKGLVFVDAEPETEVVELIEKEVIEAEHVLPVIASCRAELSDIEEKAREIARFVDGSFGVKVTRRGEHSFSSLDVARVVGAAVKEVSGKKVELNTPQLWVVVEIIGKECFFSIVPGEKFRKKYYGKELVLPLMEKTTIVQLPYLNSGEREMGKRIGRAAQAFEIKRLVIALLGPVDAKSLLFFLQGVIEGRKSRLKIQKNAYPRAVNVVEIEVDNLYTFIRNLNRKKVLLIGTDPTGKTVKEVEEELRKKLREAKEVVVLCGSRQGIPKGVLRACDFVLDLAPGITYATEHAIPAALIALGSIYTGAVNESD